MPPENRPEARSDALAELAAEAARFARNDQPPEQAAPRARPRSTTPARSSRSSSGRTRRLVNAAQAQLQEGEAGLPGYVPNAVAPERGNTRPAVPVDGRLHLRVAPATVEALDQAVQVLRGTDPVGLRDLERATLVRIGAAIVLADLDANGSDGLVGEAVRAALDPALRHLAVPMPDPARWLRDAPAEGGDG
jgi:hypothetical protein